VTDSPTLKRVLAVSDDLDLLHTRVLLLESQSYIVEAVANDNEAMNLLLTTDFDLVLLGRN
jgi:DNA-binding response OmpR family regulator